MIEDLKNIVTQMANSRVRLDSPFRGEQTRADVIKEAEEIGNLECQLRKIISDLEDKLNDLLS